jgi:hypothetical protein
MSYDTVNVLRWYYKFVRAETPIFDSCCNRMLRPRVCRPPTHKHATSRDTKIYPRGLQPAHATDATHEHSS